MVHVGAVARCLTRVVGSAPRPGRAAATPTPPRTMQLVGRGTSPGQPAAHARPMGVRPGADGAECIRRLTRRPPEREEHPETTAATVRGGESAGREVQEGNGWVTIHSSRWGGGAHGRRRSCRLPEGGDWPAPHPVGPSPRGSAPAMAGGAVAGVNVADDGPPGGPLTLVGQQALPRRVQKVGVHLTVHGAPQPHLRRRQPNVLWAGRTGRLIGGEGARLVLEVAFTLRSQLPLSGLSPAERCVAWKDSMREAAPAVL
mmetsp:Transcript_53011/g.94609  ORF Transcript_53011/g.94609 Transcript_53011/m.94609 type:complete len:258 (-) Transcript_53011:429-1202(-)